MQSLVSHTMMRRTIALRHAAATTQPPTVMAATTIRAKHSQTQIKRLFKQHPARKRVHERLGMIPAVTPPPTPTFAPIVEAPEFLSNGWCPLPPADLEMPEYPFSVSRTQNKPKDAVGFLPVYTKMR